MNPDSEKIKAFIDDYCEIVQKHGIQFSFTEGISLDIFHSNCKLVIGQTYPNRVLARFVGVLMGWRMPTNGDWTSEDEKKLARKLQDLNL